MAAELLVIDLTTAGHLGCMLVYAGMKVTVRLQPIGSHAYCSSASVEAVLPMC